MSTYKIHYKMSNGEEYGQYFDLEVVADARISQIMRGEHEWLHCFNQLHEPTGIINVTQIVSMLKVKIL